MLLTWMIAGCGSTVATESEPKLPHFAEWDGLVDAVARRKPENAHLIARDLTGGEPGGSEAVGGALGFLQIADAEELAEGLAAAAVACRDCHSGRLAFQARSVDHPGAGAELVRSVVFGGPVATTDPHLAPLLTGDSEDSIAAAFGACVSCHEGAK